MATFAETDKKQPLDMAHNRFFAAFVGLLLGDIATNKSVTIAKGILYLKCSHCRYDMAKAADLALTVVATLIFLGLIFGAFAAKRKWVSYEQVALSLIAALGIAFFTILDHSLPGPDGSQPLSLTNKLYYLGWAFVLWIVPFILLHLRDKRTRQYTETIRRGITLSAMSAAMALVCGITGSILMALMTIAQMEHKEWIVRPTTINTILAAYIVVAFASVWWPGFWNSGRFAKCLWTIGFVTFAFLYAGYFGFEFYANQNGVSQWESFLVFGAYPVVVATTVVLIFSLTHRSGRGRLAPCSASSTFWWLLPPTLALGFAIIAWLGFPHPKSPPQHSQLIVAHAVNGLVLGLSLRFFQPALRWVIP